MPGGDQEFLSPHPRLHRPSRKPTSRRHAQTPSVKPTHAQLPELQDAGTARRKSPELRRRIGPFVVGRWSVLVTVETTPRWIAAWHRMKCCRRCVRVIAEQLQVREIEPISDHVLARFIPVMPCSECNEHANHGCFCAFGRSRVHGLFRNEFGNSTTASCSAKPYCL